MTHGSLPDTLRYFRAARPVPRLMRLTFIVVTMASSVTLLLGKDARAATLLPMLLLQTFAVSTGFMGYARRGHFDLLFTRGAGRVEVAVVYWLLSAAPGILGWLTLAALEIVRHRTTVLVSSGTMAVVACVTMLPWAVNVPLARFSGATGWLLVLVMAVTLTPVGTTPYRLWHVDAGEPWWWSALAFLLFPGRLVGESLVAHAPAVFPVLALVIAMMITAFTWVSRADLPLENGQ